MQETADRTSPQPGWHPDPFGRHQLRYWDGQAWSAHVSDDGTSSTDWPSPPSVVPLPLEVDPHRLTLRRGLWLLYAVPMTGLLLSTVVLTVWKPSPSTIVDVILSGPSLLALYLHIWDERRLSGVVWKSYAILFLGWELFGWLYLEPMESGRPFGTGSLIMIAALFPLYIAVLRYAFRNWSNSADGLPS